MFAVDGITGLAVRRRWRALSALVLCCVGLAGCASTRIPPGIEPVANFELERYLGTWYEIARLDHRFERGLTRVTATYEPTDDRTVIRVINRGYDAEAARWRDADGKARFVGDPTRGHLEVSFFGPFYASYVIFHIDGEPYRHALVTGADRDVLWILSRTPTISDDDYAALVARAEALGFDTAALYRVPQG